jgi:hypothetical protein
MKTLARYLKSSFEACSGLQKLKNSHVRTTGDPQGSVNQVILEIWHLSADSTG